MRSFLCFFFQFSLPTRGKVVVIGRQEIWEKFGRLRRSDSKEKKIKWNKKLQIFFRLSSLPYLREQWRNGKMCRLSPGPGKRKKLSQNFISCFAYSIHTQQCRAPEGKIEIASEWDLDQRVLGGNRRDYVNDSDSTTTGNGETLLRLEEASLINKKTKIYTMEKLFFWGKLNFYPSLVVFFRRRNLRNLKFEIFSAPIHHSSVWCRREREELAKDGKLPARGINNFFLFFRFFFVLMNLLTLCSSLGFAFEMSWARYWVDTVDGEEEMERLEQKRSREFSWIFYHFTSMECRLCCLFFFFSSLIFKKSEKFRLIDGWHESSINYERSSTRCWADFLVKNP